MDNNESASPEESSQEELTVEEMVNVCRGRVPDELLEAAEGMEPEELFGLLMGELPNYGIKDPEAFLMESRLVDKIPTALETLFKSLHDKGLNLSVSSEEFEHLQGIIARFIQFVDLESVAGEADITSEEVQEWHREIEADKLKLLSAVIGGKIAGRINIFKDPASIKLDEDKSVPLLSDLWINPVFNNQRIEEYLVLAAENYVVNTRALSQSTSINAESSSELLLATAERLGYEWINISGLRMGLKQLSGNVNSPKQL